MKHREKAQREVTVVTKVTCDSCKKDVPALDTQAPGFMGAAVTTTISGYYGSQYDTPFSDVEFELCDDCTGKMLKFLGVNPWRDW